MATEKDITMKQYNGTDYDTLYPKTTLEQVNGWDTTYFSITTQINAKAPQYLYSTTDLTAGTSALATGVLYFVYE